MKNIKKILSVLSAMSFMGIYNIVAVPVYNNHRIVTSISETVNNSE